MTERLISADSHVKIGHDQVKRHLTARHHEAYDSAVDAFEAKMGRGAGKANRAGSVQNAVNVKNAAFTRPGYWDPAERLKDMDTDGVEAEVLYCEVSAFRYLADVQGAAWEAMRAFNDALSSSRRPTPSGWSSPTRSRSTTWTRRSPRWSGSSPWAPSRCSFPCSRTSSVSPTTSRSATTPLFAPIEEAELPICCHIGLNTSLDDLARRDPTPSGGVMVPLPRS